METDAENETRIPLVEERLHVGKEVVETGRLMLQNRVEEEQRRVQDTLASQTVRVERVPTGTLLADPPQLREETDRLVVPVFEEVYVKRYLLKEEVHLITERSSEDFEETITLRRNRVDVERARPPATHHCTATPGAVVR